MIRRLVHGDVWPENLLEHEGKLVAVLDWEHGGVGDIAMDFAALAYLPGGVLRTVTATYTAGGGRLGERFEERLFVCRLRRELMGLRHGIVHPDSGELDDALRKVRRLLDSPEMCQRIAATRDQAHN